jgi:hypothetical protein
MIKLENFYLIKHTSTKTEKTWIDFEFRDCEYNICLFCFRKNKRVSRIECIPQLKPYKSSLIKVLKNLEEKKVYNYEVIVSYIRNHKINSIIGKND